MFAPHLQSSKGVLALVLRLSFGLSAVFHGATLYKDFGGFSAMTAGDLGALSPLGMAWSYVFPLLLIVGGALVAANYRFVYGVWALGLALGSIPVGMLLKSLLSDANGGDMMAAANNAFIWLILLALTVKFSRCCGCGTQGAGNGSCTTC
ncbi:MAG: hypothetical protein AAB489_03000 [Patescibacteria group bacterium]